MNEAEKLVSISQDLRDKIVSIDWEERQFFTAVTVFESLIKGNISANSDKSPVYIGELAKTAVKSAKVFIDIYKEHLEDT
jgi:hypothetical protein